MEISPAENLDVTIVSPESYAQSRRPPEAPLIHTIGAVVGLTLPFIGLIAAMSYSWRQGWLDWIHLAIMFTGLFLTGLGVTLGYHRMLTHRSFATYYWVRVFWMMMGSLALQKSPIEWCATHRKHHALSDQPGDPHTPYDFEPGFFNSIKGFLHAHMGWILTGHIISKEQQRYVPDLLQDPMAVWIHNYWEVFWYPLSFAIPTVAAWLITGTAEGALLGFLWGGCARVFLLQHMTFSINSICHMFGRKDYQSSDESRNNLICGIFCGGEGFHNNHHAFPTSARHGLEWWQFDLTWWVIRTMELCGLAWDVKLPTPAMLERKRLPQTES